MDKDRKKSFKIITWLDYVKPMRTEHREDDMFNQEPFKLNRPVYNPISGYWERSNQSSLPVD